MKPFACPCGGGMVAFMVRGAGARETGLEVTAVPCLRDNYAYVLHRAGCSEAVVIDPSESEPVRKVLHAKALTVSQIWLTHHHWDHVGGVEELLRAFPRAHVVASLYDAQKGRVARVSHPVSEGERFAMPGHAHAIHGDATLLDRPRAELVARSRDVFGLGGPKAQEKQDRVRLDWMVAPSNQVSRDLVEVWEIPGHTLGAVAYLVGNEVFTGDTLFLAGCGRVFEGTMQQMEQSLTRLSKLPAPTRIWCGHEYTVRNLEFAQYVDPQNDEVGRCLESARRLRADNKATVPGTVEIELKTNPFLRAEDIDMQSHDQKGLFSKLRARDNSAFTRLRKMKDAF